MANFKGILPAPPVVPLQFGLFSAFDPVLHADSGKDSQWIRGFQVDYESTPSYTRIWDSLGGVSKVILSNDGRVIGNQPKFIEVDPYFLEVEDNFGVLAAMGLDRFERVKRQLEAATQKLLETEFSEGHVIRGKQQLTPYLTKSSTVTVLNGGATLSPPRAVALLERGVSNASPAGEQGIIHMTRDVAALLGSMYMLVRIEESDKTFHIETNSGTTVVLGSGYTGNGPSWEIESSSAVTAGATSWTFVTKKTHYFATTENVEVINLTGALAPLNGTWSVSSVTASTRSVTVTLPSTTVTADIAAAAAGATTLAGSTAQMQATVSTKWIYATGTVGVHLGPVDVVNENLGQARDPSGTNDMRIKATRPAVAYFDPSIHVAVKVDLTSAY